MIGSNEDAIRTCRQIATENRFDLIEAAPALGEQLILIFPLRHGSRRDYVSKEALPGVAERDLAFLPRWPDFYAHMVMISPTASKNVRIRRRMVFRR